MLCALRRDLFHQRPEVLRCCEPPTDPDYTSTENTKKSRKHDCLKKHECRATVSRQIKTRSLLITILFQPDHHIDIHTLHRKPCRIRAIVTLQRTSGMVIMCNPLWSVHGVLGFALLPRCRGLGLWVSQHFPSCISRGICWVLPTCVHGVAGPAPEREVHLVSFLCDGRSIVSLGCLLLLRAGLDGTIGAAAAGRTPPKITPRKTKIHAVPRHWHADMPNFDCRAFAKHAQNVFRSLRCFLDVSTCTRIDVGLKKCSPPSTCRQVRCCRTHLNSAKLLIRRC